MTFAEEFYFKPDAGRLFVSPARCQPKRAARCLPGDDLGRGGRRRTVGARDSLEGDPRLPLMGRTAHFARDASPVVGLDGAGHGFCWLAGQGGYGIKTSPALSRACAAVLRGQPLPEDFCPPWAPRRRAVAGSAARLVGAVAALPAAV